MLDTFSVYSRDYPYLEAFGQKERFSKERFSIAYATDRAGTEAQKHRGERENFVPA